MKKQCDRCIFMTQQLCQNYSKGYILMEFITITSAQNPAVKHLVKLRDRRTREKEQVTLLEGYRELTRAGEYGMELVECYFSPEHFLGSNEFPLLESIAAKGVKVTRLAPYLLEKITYRERPEGLLAVARMRDHSLNKLPEFDKPLYLVAETIEKPGNLGSMLRSADASGTDALIVCERMTDLYNPNEALMSGHENQTGSRRSSADVHGVNRCHRRADNIQQRPHHFCFTAGRHDVNPDRLALFRCLACIFHVPTQNHPVEAHQTSIYDIVQIVLALLFQLVIADFVGVGQGFVG